MPDDRAQRAIADNYQTVPERIAAFREKHPEGVLRGEWEMVEVAGQHFLAYTARAYKTPDDPLPGVGSAWEPVPGLTPFTRNSELQNAETSAWGRAIIAVGAADAHRIATDEDIAKADAEREERRQRESGEAEARRAAQTVENEQRRRQAMLRPLLDRYGAEHAGRVANLMEQMDAWPAEHRTALKQAFMDQFGAPKDLAPEQIGEAQLWVNTESAGWDLQPARVGATVEGQPEEGDGYGV